MSAANGRRDKLGAVRQVSGMVSLHVRQTHQGTCGEDRELRLRQL